ncbi:hypothetical protein JXL19_03500 [bacterium]|nr:hypothetical protein [bacterium]
MYYHPEYIRSIASPKNLFIAIAATIVMLNMLLPGSSHPAIRFSIPNGTITLDANHTVPFNLIENNPDGFCSWNISLEYDPNILTYTGMNTTQLTQNYTFVYPYEIYPGRVNIAGGIGFDSVTGQDFPTKGTGTFLLFNFTTKRQIPVWKTISEIKMLFKDSIGNSLRCAVCQNGSLEVLPNLQINNIDLTEDPSSETMIVSIYGQGFSKNPGAVPIPVIGSVRLSDNIIYLTSNLIIIQAPYDAFPVGLLLDIIVTNPNGDFGIYKKGFGIKARFETGINLFGYPALPHDGYDDSFGFLTNLGESGGNIKRLRAFDPNDSIWLDTHWNNGQPEGINFMISSFQSYLMYIDGKGFSRAFPGCMLKSSVEEQISEIAGQAESGLNFITIHPQPYETIHSWQAMRMFYMKNINDAVISRLESKSAKWQSSFLFFDHESGDRFHIENMNGYILYRP